MVVGRGSFTGKGGIMLDSSCIPTIEGNGVSWER